MTANEAIKHGVTGVVHSCAMQNTCVVKRVVKVPHPRYGKRIKRTTTFYVHVADGQEVREGDTVRIVPSRPRSKLKTWELVDVVDTTAKTVAQQLGEEA